MDETDLKIVQILASNATASAESISGQLKKKNISLTSRAIRKRITILENKGLIKKYITIFDESISGASYKRLVLVKFKNTTNFLQRVDAYKQYISDSPFCTFALRIRGDFDWLHYKCFPTKELADREEDLFRTVFGDIIDEHGSYDVEIEKNRLNDIIQETDIKSFLKQVSNDITIS
ncbi:MAG: winged-helix domain-containing protein [Nanoarchaeota archaeon]|jgi:DNA-binding Lrp family transcriptional regulator